MRISRADAFEFHVPHVGADLAEEDLLLHSMRESNCAADFRPSAAMPLRDHVHKILRVVRFRISLVGAEVRPVLEAGLGDDAASRQVLVGPEPKIEVRLNGLRFLDEPRQADRPVRLPRPPSPALTVPPGRTRPARSARGPNTCSASSWAPRLAGTPGNRPGLRGTRRRTHVGAGPGTRGTGSRTKAPRPPPHDRGPAPIPDAPLDEPRADRLRRDRPPRASRAPGRRRTVGSRSTRGCRGRWPPPGR